jgi:uncharacterized protein (DUF2236 family)
MSLVADPLQRATALGTQLALSPLRLVGTLAEGRRRELGRDVRRSIGVPTEPPPRASDPAQVYLPLDAVARRVHGDLASMMIGGLSALLLQALHPLAMAGVAEHSDYANDPLGRLQRTSAFIGYTTYGTTEQARVYIDRVLQVHEKVHGIAPDGRPYAASDPELVTWIHVAEVSSFLHAAQRFGPHRFSPDECDRYYEETSVVPYELGAAWAPRSVDEVKAYFRRMRPELYAGPQALAAKSFLLRGVATKPEDRAVYTVLAAAAISLLPGWAKSEFRLPSPPLADRLVTVPLGLALCAGLRWALALPETLRGSGADQPSRSD